MFLLVTADERGTRTYDQSAVFEALTLGVFEAG